MKRLTTSQLDTIERYRPYKRPRLGMGWFNALFVALVFIGGTFAYEPTVHEHTPKQTAYFVEPGDLPALTEEELVSVDWRTQ